MLAQLRAPVFDTVFQLVSFGTLVEACAALIRGIAVALLVISLVLASKVGIVQLIAKGYGYSTYVFLVLVAVPVPTRGLWLIWRRCEAGGHEQRVSIKT